MEKELLKICRPSHNEVCLNRLENNIEDKIESLFNGSSNSKKGGETNKYTWDKTIQNEQDDILSTNSNGEMNENHLLMDQPYNSIFNMSQKINVSSSDYNPRRQMFRAGNTMKLEDLKVLKSIRSSSFSNYNQPEEVFPYVDNNSIVFLSTRRSDVNQNLKSEEYEQRVIHRENSLKQNEIFENLVKEDEQHSEWIEEAQIDSGDKIQLKIVNEILNYDVTKSDAHYQQQLHQQQQLSFMNTNQVDIGSGIGSSTMKNLWNTTTLPYSLNDISDLMANIEYTDHNINLLQELNSLNHRINEIEQQIAQMKINSNTSKLQDENNTDMEPNLLKEKLNEKNQHLMSLNRELIKLESEREKQRQKEGDIMKEVDIGLQRDVKLMGQGIEEIQSLKEEVEKDLNLERERMNSLEERKLLGKEELIAKLIQRAEWVAEMEEFEQIQDDLRNNYPSEWKYQKNQINLMEEVRISKNSLVECQNIRRKKIQLRDSLSQEIHSLKETIQKRQHNEKENATLRSQQLRILNDQMEVIDNQICGKFTSLGVDNSESLFLSLFLDDKAFLSYQTLLRQIQLIQREENYLNQQYILSVQATKQNNSNNMSVVSPRCITSSSQDYLSLSSSILSNSDSLHIKQNFFIRTTLFRRWKEQAQQQLSTLKSAKNTDKYMNVSSYEIISNHFNCKKINCEASDISFLSELCDQYFLIIQEHKLTSDLKMLVERGNGEEKSFNIEIQSIEERIGKIQQEKEDLQLEICKNQEEEKQLNGIAQKKAEQMNSQKIIMDNIILMQADKAFRDYIEQQSEIFEGLQKTHGPKKLQQIQLGHHRQFREIMKQNQEKRLLQFQEIDEGIQNVNSHIQSNIKYIETSLQQSLHNLKIEIEDSSMKSKQLSIDLETILQKENEFVRQRDSLMQSKNVKVVERLQEESRFMSQQYYERSKQLLQNEIEECEKNLRIIEQNLQTSMRSDILLATTVLNEETNISNMNVQNKQKDKVDIVNSLNKQLEEYYIQRFTLESRLIEINFNILSESQNEKNLQLIPHESAGNVSKQDTYQCQMLPLSNLKMEENLDSQAQSSQEQSKMNQNLQFEKQFKDFSGISRKVQIPSFFKKDNLKEKEELKSHTSSFFGINNENPQRNDYLLGNQEQLFQKNNSQNLPETHNIVEHLKNKNKNLTTQVKNIFQKQQPSKFSKNFDTITHQQEDQEEIQHNNLRICKNQMSILANTEDKLNDNLMLTKKCELINQINDLKKDESNIQLEDKMGLKSLEQEFITQKQRLNQRRQHQSRMNKSDQNKEGKFIMSHTIQYINDSMKKQMENIIMKQTYPMLDSSFNQDSYQMNFSQEQQFKFDYSNDTFKHQIQLQMIHQGCNQIQNDQIKPETEFNRQQQDHFEIINKIDEQNEKIVQQSFLPMNKGHTSFNQRKSIAARKEHLLHPMQEDAFLNSQRENICPNTNKMVKKHISNNTSLNYDSQNQKTHHSAFFTPCDNSFVQLNNYLKFPSSKLQNQQKTGVNSEVSSNFHTSFTTSQLCKLDLTSNLQPKNYRSHSVELGGPRQKITGKTEPQNLLANLETKEIRLKNRKDQVNAQNPQAQQQPIRRFVYMLHLESLQQKEIQFLMKIKELLEGSMLLKKFSQFQSLKQNTFNALTGEQIPPENCGYGTRIITLNKNLTKIEIRHPLKQGTIESYIQVDQILRHTIPLSTIELLKVKHGDSRAQSSILSQTSDQSNDIQRTYYAFCMILDKGGRIEFIAQDFKTFTIWTEGIAQLIKHKKQLPRLKNNIQQIAII